VINLKHRTDRWSEAISQASSLMLPIIRVDAVSISNLSPEDVFVAPGVAATWKSHQFAMATFLASGEEYALILEDDFLVTRKWNHNLLSIALDTCPDFFQIGYLITDPMDRIDLFFKNWFDSVLKIIYKLCGYSGGIRRKFGSRLLITEQKGLGHGVVPNDIRAGGQAYIVSRRFALAAQTMNSPAFTSADGMFMTLGDVRTFRMFRFRHSIINQTDSVSSVEQRFL